MVERRRVEYYVNERGCNICISHSCDSNGYPQTARVIEGKCVTLKIVRYLWQQVYGSVPEGLVLRHSCDETKCINLEHVLLGTQADNVADRVARGRSAKGISCGTGKITEDDVRFIRTNVVPNGGGLSIAELARKFNIHRDSVRCIIIRKIWKHVR